MNGGVIGDGREGLNRDLTFTLIDNRNQSDSIYNIYRREVIRQKNENVILCCTKYRDASRAEGRGCDRHEKAIIPLGSAWAASENEASTSAFLRSRPHREAFETHWRNVFDVTENRPDIHHHSYRTENHIAYNFNNEYAGLVQVRDRIKELICPPFLLGADTHKLIPNQPNVSGLHLFPFVQGLHTTNFSNGYIY